MLAPCKAQSNSARQQTAPHLYMSRGPTQVRCFFDSRPKRTRAG